MSHKCIECESIDWERNLSSLSSSSSSASFSRDNLFCGLTEGIISTFQPRTPLYLSPNRATRRRNIKRNKMLSLAKGTFSSVIAGMYSISLAVGTQLSMLPLCDRAVHVCVIASLCFIYRSQSFRLLSFIFGHANCLRRPYTFLLYYPYKKWLPWLWGI